MTKVAPLTKRKCWLWVGLMATAIAVPALSGVARADGCSNATLKSEYAFGVTVLTTQKFVAGIKFFDGNGNVTQRDYQANATPAEFAPPGQERGTYTVNPDLIHCSAVLTGQGAILV